MKKKPGSAKTKLAASMAKQRGVPRPIYPIPHEEVSVVPPTMRMPEVSLHQKVAPPPLYPISRRAATLSHMGHGHVASERTSRAKCEINAQLPAKSTLRGALD